MDNLEYFSARDDGHAFDMPHQRQAHILNTPCLISHRLMWHADYPRPIKGQPWKEKKAWDGIYKTRDGRKLIKGRLKYDREFAAIRINKSLDGIEDLSDDIFQPLNFDERFTNTPPHIVHKLHKKCVGDEKAVKTDSEKEAYKKRADNFRYKSSVYLNKTLAVSGRLYGLYFEITAEIHKEYHTITVRAFPLEAANLRPEWKTISEIRNHLKSLSNKKSAGKTAREDYTEDLLFEQFWNEFRDKIYDASPLKHSDAPADKQKRKTRFFGTNEAVFQGVIFRNISWKLQQKRSRQLPKGANPNQPNADCKIIESFSPLKKVAKSKSTSNSELDVPSSEPISLIEDNRRLNPDLYSSLEGHVNEHTWFFGPFFGFGNGEQWIEATRPTNSVMSTIGGGLAIYGSDLGAHDHSSVAGATRITRFFIIYGGNSRDQLGRLSRLLLHCAEMRIVALKRYTKTKSLQAKIRRLTSEYMDLYGSAAIDGDPADLRTKFKDLDSRFRRLLELYQLYQTGIQRSRSYFKNLVRFIERLREGRVVGWQTYQDFIDARFTAPRANASMISTDYGLLIETRERVEQHILWNEANEQRNEIKTIQVQQKTLQDQQRRSSKRMLFLTFVILGATMVNMLPIVFGGWGILAVAAILAVLAGAACGYVARMAYDWILLPRRES